jgi:hypothetical protein
LRLTLFFSFLVVLGFELRASSFLCKHSITWATPVVWDLFFWLFHSSEFSMVNTLQAGIHWLNFAGKIM